jgi:hypothetical protein
MPYIGSVDSYQLVTYPGNYGYWTPQKPLILYLLIYIFNRYYLTYLKLFFAELLRVIRRLNLKEQWTDLPLHFITLYALRSTISENTRAQNHFRSIGGLEVLLDGLGLPSSKFSVSKQSFVPSDERWVFTASVVKKNQTFTHRRFQRWKKRSNNYNESDKINKVDCLSL